MNLLWLDMETTGLVEPIGILEIAVVVTDKQFNELARDEWLIRCYGQGEKMDAFVTAMHTKSGLLGALALPGRHWLEDAQQEILDLADPFLDDGKIALAGSGVATFDLQIIKQQLRGLADKLTYWTLDIGVVRRFLRLCNALPSEQGEIAHRAMADVESAIAQAVAYRAIMSPESGRLATNDRG